MKAYKKNGYTKLWYIHSFSLIYYSERNATTGSFLAALLEGIRPEINVSNTLITTIIIAAGRGKIAFKLLIPVTLCMIKLIGIQRIYVTTTPKSPAEKPTIIVSALNILDTFLFDAPIARKIPISFVL